jgi:hypothetical protein
VTRSVEVSAPTDSPVQLLTDTEKCHLQMCFADRWTFLAYHRDQSPRDSEFYSACSAELLSLRELAAKLNAFFDASLLDVCS